MISLLKKTACLIAILTVGSSVACSQATGDTGKEQPPNVLLIMADDMAYHDVQNEQISTPNLDRLAGQGITFENMFNSAPMCAPTRMSLYTGIHPVRNGAHPNHSRVYPSIRSWPQYLNDLGYRTALMGKRHEAPAENFPFEFLGGRHHDGGRGIDLDLSKARSFMEESKDQPWSLIVTSNQPHRPWNRGTSFPYDADNLELPPYLIDTPETRQALARYYGEISYLDQQVGQVLQHLKETGQAENTIVLFLSEHGSNFPHSKWTAYDTGVRSTGIMRWPGKIAEGVDSEALVQYVDVLPTLLNIAGGNAAEHDFDGESFLPLLKGEEQEHREYAYSMQTSKGIYYGPDAYGIRTVRTQNYRLIWNLNWKSEFSNMVTKGSKFYTSWKEKAEEGDPFAQKRFNWYQKRPQYELYDVRVDPYELHNLADDPKYKEVKDRLTAKLEDWMKQQGDKGVETERNALNRQSDRWLN